ncbi:MAG: flippase-like domain-containing protein [Bdellovibrionales bacterium]|nr:flippase-like domain-containing protein [Bdellovibrionales bacterium]
MTMQPAERKKRRGSNVRAYLGIAVSLVCIWWVFRSVEAEQLFHRVKNVEPGWLVLAVVTTFLSYVVRSVRWPYFFGERAPSFHDSFRCLIVGFFMNNVLPARIGELVRAHLGGRATKQSRSVVLATIAGERLADGLMISLLFAMLFSLAAAPEEHLRAKEIFYVAYAFFGVTFFTFAVLLARNPIFALLERLKSVLPGTMSTYALVRIRRFINGLEPLLRPSRIVILGTLSLIVWAIELAVYYQVTRAFDVPMSLGALGLFLAAVNFSSLIPAAPGGIGVIEAFATLALVRIGIDHETGLAMVASQHLIQYAVVGIPGALYFFLNLGGKIPEAEEVEEDDLSSDGGGVAQRPRKEGGAVAADLADEELIDVSIILPAYNEENRVGRTLDSILDYFTTRNATFEVLVVDDGSLDGTSAVVRDFERRSDAVRLLVYTPNRGKGYAVKYGMLNARGRRLLYNDADGATPIEEIERLEHALDEGAQVAIGSRAMFSRDTAIKTVWYRKAIGRIFNGLVNLIVLPGIADTQCGFKMFTRPVARALFDRQRAERFSFDVELLFLARKGNYRIVEVPINWVNVPGSKVHLVKDSTAMFIDLLRFRLRDLLGGYRQLPRL